MLYLLTQRQVHEVNYFNSFMLFIRTIATDKPGFACWISPELVKRDGENLILPYPAKVKISSKTVSKILKSIRVKASTYFFE